MLERKPEQGLVELKTIGVEKAAGIRDVAIGISRGMNVLGFFVAYSRTGMQETSQATGGTPLNVEIALAKIKTVLAVRRSTSVQRERMKAKGQSRDDFAGQLGSLLGGGVAIFADKELTEFVGAVAFSGGTEEQDEEICRRAVVSNGLYTDLLE